MIGKIIKKSKSDKKKDDKQRQEVSETSNAMTTVSQGKQNYKTMEELLQAIPSVTLSILNCNFLLKNSP